MGILRVLAESSESALRMNDIRKESRAEIKREVVNLFGEGFLDKFHQPIDHIELQKDRNDCLLDGALL